MANIKKVDKEEVQKKEQLLQNLEKVQVGQIYVYRDQLIKVREIKKLSKSSDQPTVYYDHSDDLGKTWSSYGGEEVDRFLKDHEGDLIEDLGKWYKEVLAVINGEKSISDYKDNQDLSKETGLMVMRSKEHLVAIKEEMELKRNKADIIAKGVYLEMERRKDELDTIRRQLGVVVKEFQDKVAQIEKVIWTIELYLGIKEDIVQIQVGQSAGESEAINFWQNTLYMDHEVGDPVDQGLDFNKIEDFDSWLLKYSTFYKKFNYELLVPQQKGMLCLKVRKNDKHYTDNPWINGMMNQENHMTYILIRNGTNVYRIWGDITIFPKLFPDRSELEELRQKWEFLTDVEESKGTTYIGESKYGHISDTGKEKKDIDKQLFRYKQYMIMMQGLIDRTEIFYPLPTRISLMSPESHDKGYVKFVYEDDLRLTDGKLSFKDWQKELNKTIGEGSRILFVKEVPRSESRGEDYERFDQRYHQGKYWGGKTHYNLPSLPDTGIYQVKKYVTKVTERVTEIANSKSEVPEYVIRGWAKGYFDNKDRFPYKYQVKEDDSYKYHTIQKSFLAIYYNPGDEVRDMWDYHDYGHERKNCISYKIFPEDMDVLNYDNIDLKDIEYYLHERRHRKEYLKMMPVLFKIKKQREEELKKELEFVKGLVADMIRNKQKIENPKQVIWDTIEWFKTKNKWKRPLTENDGLAWRMIKKKLGLKE